MLENSIIAILIHIPINYKTIDIMCRASRWMNVETPDSDDDRESAARLLRRSTKRGRDLNVESYKAVVTRSN